MSLNFEIIGRRIRFLRQQNQMTQAVLAERTDLSVAYVSLIETAKKQASLESLVRIAEALGTTVDHLLAGNQVNDPVVYQADIAQLIEDCSRYEKKVIYEIALAVKKSLREYIKLQK